MNTVKAYEEVINFIATGTTPQKVIAFRPSEAAQEHVEKFRPRPLFTARIFDAIGKSSRPWLSAE